MALVEEELPKKQALYLQVYHILAKRIDDSILRNGTYLPNEYELSRELDVSIGTIRKAVDLLSQARLVVRQQGKGTIVCDQRWLDVNHKLNRIYYGDAPAVATWKHTRLSYERLPASEDIAKILHIAPLEPVHHVQELREMNGQGGDFAVDTIYIAVALIPELQLSNSEFPTLPELCRMQHIQVGNVEEKLNAVTASTSIAKLLSVEEGTPVLKIVRTAYTDDGMPIEYRISHIATNDSYYFASA